MVGDTDEDTDSMPSSQNATDDATQSGGSVAPDANGRAIWAGQVVELVERPSSIRRVAEVLAPGETPFDCHVLRLEGANSHFDDSTNWRVLTDTCATVPAADQPIPFSFTVAGAGMPWAVHPETIREAIFEAISDLPEVLTFMVEESWHGG